MGYTQTSKQHQKLLRLLEEGRACQHAKLDGGSCLIPATVSMVSHTTNYDADGAEGHKSSDRMRYCKRHFRRMLKSFDAHGEADPDEMTIATVNDYDDGRSQVSVYEMDSLKEWVGNDWEPVELADVL